MNAFQQSQKYKSHNGGWVMAAGATTLNIKLGGRSIYEGKKVLSPLLGQGACVTVADIPRSLKLVRRASALFIIAILIIAGSLYFWKKWVKELKD